MCNCPLCSVAETGQQTCRPWKRTPAHPVGTAEGPSQSLPMSLTGTGFGSPGVSSSLLRWEQSTPCFGTAVCLWSRARELPGPAWLGSCRGPAARPVLPGAGQQGAASIRSCIARSWAGLTKQLLCWTPPGLLKAALTLHWASTWTSSLCMILGSHSSAASPLQPPCPSTLPFLAFSEPTGLWTGLPSSLGSLPHSPVGWSPRAPGALICLPPHSHHLSPHRFFS